MTASVIECAVRAANKSLRTYDQAKREIVLVVELVTGFKEGDQFTIQQVEEEMSKYTWRS